MHVEHHETTVALDSGLVSPLLGSTGEEVRDKIVCIDIRSRNSLSSLSLLAYDTPESRFVNSPGPEYDAELVIVECVVVLELHRDTRGSCGVPRAVVSVTASVSIPYSSSALTASALS